MTESETSPQELPAYSTLRNQWLRKTRPEGIDPEKFILGETLSDIVGDDGNYFVWYRSLSDQEDIAHFQSTARTMQEEYKARLMGEIKTPELPQEIITKLETTLNGVKSENWGDRETFLNARDKWRALSAEVRETMKTNLELDESVDYYINTMETADKLYLDSHSLH